MPTRRVTGLHELPWLVVDFGSAALKVGLAGEASPLFCMRTVMGVTHGTSCAPPPFFPFHASAVLLPAHLAGLPWWVECGLLRMASLFF